MSVKSQSRRASTSSSQHAQQESHGTPGGPEPCRVSRSRGSTGQRWSKILKGELGLRKEASPGIALFSKAGCCSQWKLNFNTDHFGMEKTWDSLSNTSIFNFWKAWIFQWGVSPFLRACDIISEVPPSNSGGGYRVSNLLCTQFLKILTWIDLELQEEMKFTLETSLRIRILSESRVSIRVTRCTQ